MKNGILKVTVSIMIKKIWKYCILIIIPLVYLAVFNVLLSYLVQQGINEAISGQSISKLLIILASLIFSCLIFILFFYIYNILRFKIKNSICYELRYSFLRGYMKIPYEKGLQYSSGDISVRFMEDCESCAGLIPYVLIPIVKLVINILFGIAYVVFFSWQMAILALLLMPLFYLVNIKLLNKLGIANAKKKEMEGKQRTLFQEVFENLDVIKVFGMKPKLCLQNKKYYDIKKDYIFNESKSSVDMDIMTKGGITLLEVTSLFIGVLAAGFGMISIGTVVGVWNAITGSLIFPISDIPFYMEEIKKVIVSWNRISDFINLLSQEEKQEAGSRQKINEIMLVDISYGYEEVQRDILKQISVKFDKKEIIILQGASGSGKTTLIKLLLGLLSPKSGGIVCKSDMGSVIGEVRDEILYLPQKCVLFSISIYDNICMGLEVPKINVIEIMKDLNLHEWIETLPKKYDTIIGVDQEISGGEAQRICLARCLVRNPSFIIMDEPFSALDQNNISLIYQKLERLHNQGMGCIISTHIYPANMGEQCKIIKVNDGGVYYE